MFSSDSKTKIMQIADELARVIGVGLGQLSSDIQTRSLQILEAIGQQFHIFDVHPPVPTVTKSVGTASRDYSTRVAWEADIDNGAIYASGDTALGECYNDSVFTDELSLNGGGTIGLAAAFLSVATGQRHNGTAGTGARVNCSGKSFGVECGVTNIRYVIEWLEMRGWGAGGLNKYCVSIGSTDVNDAVRYCILDGESSPHATCVDYVSMSRGGVKIHNNIMLNANGSNASGFGVGGSVTNSNTQILNNTIYKQSGNGISSKTGGEVCRNNISMGSGGDDFNETAASFGTEDHNLSEDATAEGTGSLASKVVSTQFVSTVSGSEDLHLKAGADAIDAGSDLATTPSGVNFDIDNRDRDALNDTWDMGADEFVAAAAGIVGRAYVIGQAVSQASSW